MGEQYLWLLGVGLLMGLYQAIWWVVAAYLLVGVVLFLIWDNDDRHSYPYAKTRWYEFIFAIVVIALVWPIAILTRRFCSGP